MVNRKERKEGRGLDRIYGIAEGREEKGLTQRRKGAQRGKERNFLS